MRLAINQWVWASLVSLLAAVALAGPAFAADRSYTTAFDWTDPSVGFAGWTFQEYDGNGAAVPSNFYRGQTETGPLGRGLTIRPTGAGGANYPAAISGRFTYGVPGRSGASQVDLREVAFQRLTARVRERQALRFELRDPMGAFRTRELRTSADDIDNGSASRTVTLTDDNASRTGRNAVQWMFQLPCDVPSQPQCAPVDPDAGSVNYAGGAELTLLDHESPGIAASGPAYEQRERWVNSTPTSLTIAAEDPGSGVRSYVVRGTGPGGSRTVLRRTVACDLKHTDDALGSQQCPTNPGPSTRDAGAIGPLPTGISTFVATSRDLAGQVSRPLRWRLKVDRANPRPPVAAKLSRLNGRFVGAGKTMAVPVSSTDTHSGLVSITAEIRNAAGTRQVDLTPAELCRPAATQCPRIGKALFRFDPSDEPTGTSTITLRASDLAGNTATARPVRLRIDRERPASVKFSTEPGNRFFTAVSWKTPRDSGGSGIAHYESRLVNVGGQGKAVVSPQQSGFQLVRGAKRVRLPSNGLAVQIRALDGADNAGLPTTSPVRPPDPFGRSVIRPELQLSFITKACKGVKLARGPVRAALKKAGVPSGAVDAAIDILLVICDFEGKAENEIVDQLSKPVKSICKKGGDICKKTINVFCKIAGKTACRYLKKAACFASDLDIFCTSAAKREKRIRKKAEKVKRRKAFVAKRAVVLRREQRLYKIGRGVFGDSRYYARDRRNRATGARGKLNAKTVRYRRGPGKNQKKARVRNDQLTGLKPGCGLQKGHILAGSLGGVGSDPRNFVPLPANFNQGAMAQLERRIGKAAEQGRELLVEVRPRYRRGESVPYRMDFRVTQTGGRRLKTSPFNLNEKLKVPRPKKGCR